MNRRTLLSALALLTSTLALPAARAAGDMTDAEVRKVDQEAGKITLKHGEIKNLDMPAMTMVFRVKDKALLASVKAGDRVRFKAASEDGQYLVTELQLLR